LKSSAAEADVGPAYFGQVERGAVNVGIVILGRVANTLGARLADLFVEPLPGSKPPKPLQAGRRRMKPRS
jgi:hypothetical protein